MSLVKDALIGLIEANRILDGRIYDPDTDTYGSASSESEQAARMALQSIVDSTVQLFPEAISFRLPNGNAYVISRETLVPVVEEVQAAIRAYVVATTEIN